MPTKESSVPQSSLEIPPNYVRRAMGLVGRRVIISHEAQIMMRIASNYTAFVKFYGQERADHVVSAVSGSKLHTHQLDAMDHLRELPVQQPIVLDSYPWGK